jgi:signal transduction histidine kinase
MDFTRYFTTYFPDSSESGMKNGGWDIHYGGMSVAMSKRDVFWHQNTFRMPLTSTPKGTVYMRLSGDFVLSGAAEVVSETVLLSRITQERVFFGLYYGIVLAMFLYNLFVWFSVRDRAYLLYLGYIFFFAVYFGAETGLWFEVLPKSIVEMVPITITPIFAHLMGVFALLFTIEFLQVRRYAPRFMPSLRGVLLFLVLAILGTLIIGWEENYFSSSVVFLVLRFTLAIIILTILVLAIECLRRGAPSAWYFLAGWSVLLLTTILYAINANIVGYGTSSMLADWLFGFHINFIGSAIEMLLFAFALGNRINLLQETSRLAELRATAAEYQASIERETTRLQERERIFRDIHDGLGAQIVEIVTMTEQLKSELPPSDTFLGNNTQGAWVQAITESVGNLRSSLREIVWLLNMENDTLEALIAYLRQETARLAEAASMRFRLDSTGIPSSADSIAVAPELRRSIIMAVREACSNAVKHAKAEELVLRVELENDVLAIIIQDNGAGFDASSVGRFSNGLKTMEKRMKSVQGSFLVESERGKGTRVRLGVPLGT